MKFSIELRAMEAREQTKIYDSYDAFIADWRFWMSSGAPYKEGAEETFQATMAGLEKLARDGASMSFTLSGMRIMFTISLL